MKSGTIQHSQPADLEPFLEVFTRAPIGMFVVQDGVFKFINPEFESNSGYVRDELLDKDSLSLVPSKDRPTVREKVIAMLKGDRGAPFEVEFRTKDGTTKWAVESVASRTYQGRRAVLGYFMDVTPYKQLREVYRETKDQYQTVVDQLNDAISIIVDGKRVFVNKAFLDLFGLGEYSQAIGTTESEFILPEDRATLTRYALARQRGESAPGRYEARIIRPDGDVRTAEISVAAITYKGKRASLSVIRDITERNMLEKALEAERAELARSNAELEQFAHLASHDLQEPLRTITSYVQLLERRYKDSLDADAKDFINYTVDGTARMQRLIDGLLAYARVTTQAREMQEVNCNALLQDVIANLKRGIEECSASITYSYLPTVTGDPTQLSQLFQNLVGNAIKFRGAEPPKVHLSADSTDNEWLFRVRDNGIGIDPQDAEAIFQIFQRLHSRSEYPGTGIGLAVCKKIVERHGGEIWVKRNREQGSTFYFTISKKAGS